MSQNDPLGQLEVITGCMFSGKTSELLRRIRRAEIADYRTEVFTPSVDTRFGENKIGSHSGQMWECKVIDPESDMQKLYNLATGCETVAVDEGNFFEESVVPVAERLADEGTRVIVSGLDQTFRGEGFNPMPELISVADSVEKLTAICEVCGRTATKTQRLIDGEPAPYNAPTVDVGKEERYEARCRRCHTVSRTNQKNTTD